jgi:hypothetical protein
VALGQGEEGIEVSITVAKLALSLIVVAMGAVIVHDSPVMGFVQIVLGSFYCAALVKKLTMSKRDGG